MRLKAVEFLEKWNSSFGIHYRQIRLGFDYLKNTIRFQFPNVQNKEENGVLAVLDCDENSEEFHPLESRQLRFDINIEKLKLDESLGCEGGGIDFSSLRSKLMAGAPVIKWGSFLDTWGSNRDVLASHRGLELESHRGRVDDDAVIPAKKIAGLNLQATLYKEDQVEIQPC
ncbi:hypothetical protein DKX38_003119 [Salix brachista]|uniref:UV-stimulated scaffold protein A C-terminal domain-containing protein n=1 Tax=Salix brachista TaxID=2182728 RepID=A0A5N5NSF8_9ROSI|nr:hypothetical protein DKX38_003119 [Salix brachista]